MLTRRQTIAGLISAATGGAVLSAGAFTSSVSAGADMRVVVVSDLLLEPAREDESYVETDEDGLVEAIVLEELNSSAISRFSDLGRVRNEGTVTYDELSFELEIQDSNGEQTEIEDVLQILINDTELDGIGDDERVAVDGLEPGGDGVPFGLLVNLSSNTTPGSLSTLPDDGVDVRLRVVAHSE